MEVGERKLGKLNDPYFNCLNLSLHDLLSKEIAQSDANSLLMQLKQLTLRYYIYIRELGSIMVYHFPGN